MKMNRPSAGFLELLNQPLKILSQNGKLMAITATIYVIVYSISFILFTFSMNPFTNDLAFKTLALVSSKPGTPENTQILVDILEDAGISIGIEAAYMVLFFFILLFAQTAVVIIASSYYNGDGYSLRKLIVKVSKTWTRPFVTSFYVQLLGVGYACFFFLPLLVPSLVLFNHPAILITVLILMAILFTIFYIYLSVVWSLAIVVSVVEDSYGYAALGKARELVKGKRVYGFFLTSLLLLVLLIVIIVGAILSPVMPIVVGVLQTVVIGVVSMFQFMAYSAYYFQCKNDMEYSQILMATALDVDFP